MKKENKITLIIIIAAIMVVIGATFAVWVWSTNTEEQTSVAFTVTPEFSCSADGGGNLTSNDKMLAPAACTNTTYAIKRTITIRPTLSQNVSDIYLDLWLKVNQIGAGLSATSNMKYALTTSPTNCQTGVVASGNFKNATTDTQKRLLHNKIYSSVTPDTYYLWIWLDAAEESDEAQNQTFNIELGGSCTDEAPTTFSGTIYRYSTETISIGDSIVPQAIQTWCANSSEWGNSCDFDVSWDTVEECESYVSEHPDMGTTTCESGTKTTGLTSYETDPANLEKTFYLKHTIVNDIVTESYVEFVVTDDMAEANTGMTAGTYYLRGLDTYDTTTGTCKSQYLIDDNCVSPYFETNQQTLQSAFGENSGYCSGYSDYYYCSVSGLRPSAGALGQVYVGVDKETNCAVDENGTSRCNG